MKQFNIKLTIRFSLFTIFILVFLNILYQTTNQDIGLFTDRVSSIYSDVEQQSGTYGSRLSYIETQLAFWGNNPLFFIIGVIFTPLKQELAYLLVTNNGFTEEILLYGLPVAILLIVSYIYGVIGAYKANVKSNQREIRSLTSVVLAFMICSLIVHPVLFSLFHNPLNISGTVVAIVTANKLKTISF